MEQPAPPPGKNRNDASPLLFFLIVGVIIAAILAFLIIRPHPAFAVPNSTTPASQR